MPQPHRLSAYIRQITYGGNDGITTTFAIVAGFAGASLEGAGQIGAVAVLVFGLANLFADGVSMGLGEFLSGTAQRDLYRQRHQALAGRIGAGGGAEAGRLRGLLQARGMTEADAGQTAQILARHPRMMAEILLAQEARMTDPGGSPPALNGLVTFLSFLVFGSVPLLPYVIAGSGDALFRASLVASALALTVLGLLRWRATGDRFIHSVLETIAVGAVCGGVAYLVGVLVGG